jgi:hypothetical protein
VVVADPERKSFDASLWMSVSGARVAAVSREKAALSTGASRSAQRRLARRGNPIARRPKLTEVRLLGGPSFVRRSDE